MVTAIVMIKADRKSIPETAQALADIEGVAEVYSISGDYDIIAILRVPEYDQLATLVTRIDNRTEPVEPALDTFLDWVPTPEGFHVYVPVAHVLGDYLPVTVPWNDIADLMTPQMRTALIG